MGVEKTIAQNLSNALVSHQLFDRFAIEYRSDDVIKIYF